MADRMIEASWVEFLERCIDAETAADDFLIRELRIAFIAGATRMWGMLTRNPALGPAFRAEIEEYRREIHAEIDGDNHG